MIVTCEDCGASFNLDEKLIKPTGSKVRCSKCKSVFTVMPISATAQQQAAEETTQPGQQPTAQAPAAGDQGLSDLDSRLDDIFGEEGHGNEMAELGEMTDLDLESAQLSAEAPDDGDDDFNLDLDSDTDELLAEMESEDLGGSDAISGDQGLAEVDDELDLDLDLLDADDGEADLDDDELPQIDDLLDLSGEDLDPDLDNLAVADEPSTAGTDDSEADALDLDLDLGDAPESAESAGNDEKELEFDLQAGSAEEGVDGEDTGADDLDIDEIDLSDIEEMLSDEDAVVGSPAAADQGAEEVAEDGGELDLSDFARELAEDDSTGDASGTGSEDVEFDLDLDLSDESIPEPDAETPKDELDFSDLADALESDATASPPDETEDKALELDLDLGDGGDAVASATEPGNDSLDLDSMLDDGAGAGDEEELDLTLELDGLPDDSRAPDAAQPELEFDLGEADADFSHEDELELNLLDEDEPESAAFGATTQAIPADAGGTTGGLAAGAQEIGATTDDFATEEFTDARDLTGDSDFMAEDDADMPPPGVKPKRSRKPLVAVLVGLILVVAALIVPKFLGIRIPVLSDIEIPYVSGWIGGSEKSDPGNLKIIPLGKTINAKFVDNQNAGKLLVVSGQVRNEYEHERSFIQLAGKLLNKDGSLAQSTTVYAGNMISTLDLARMEPTEIKDQLQNKAGQRKSNLNVKKGRVVPFMIVFDRLPPAMDEYTVEVVGSSRN